MMSESGQRWRTIAATLMLVGALCLQAVGMPSQPQDRPVQEDDAKLTGESLERAVGAPRLALRGPIDETVYVVGPGDRFRVTLWGPTVITLDEAVTPEGDLVLPGIASAPVAGLTLRDAKAQLARRLDAVYRNVEMSISLIELRTLLVNVLGAVEEPGSYEATALDPASLLIDNAGGLLDAASERNIVVRRRGGAEERVDLVRYRNTGDVEADPPVVDGDVIFVPFATAYVYVGGGVPRPGRYELVPGETVGSLIRLAGGLTRGALSDTLELRTFTDSRRSERRLLSFEAAANVVLRDGDQVTVRLDPHWRTPARVHVRGEVRYPGTYGIAEGVDRLSDIVERAGGLTDDASPELSSLFRPGEDVEEDPEFQRLSDVSPADMEALEYAYMKVLYRSRAGRVSLDFAEALSGDAERDALLVDGDIVYVAERTNTVNVIGEVANPGRIEHVSGKNYRYYLDEAGGLSSGAWGSRLRVIKASNGSRRPARRAGALEPGDILWVPEKPETDWLEVLTDFAALVSSAATVYLVFKN
jgi:protein involved in polysaccharide export with SLBB domain